MATITKGKTFVNGELVTPEKIHQLVDAATVTAIATADISNNAITTAKIADSNVTTAKLADSAITSAKIADGTIVNADISASAAIALSKLATGALPTAITVASANIVDGTIVNADIAAGAAIADTKLATISTSGKVSNSATTATSNNTAANSAGTVASRCQELCLAAGRRVRWPSSDWDLADLERFPATPADKEQTEAAMAELVQ